MKLSLEQQYMLSVLQRANIMPADAFVILGSRTSSGMVLIQKSEYSVSTIRRVNTIFLTQCT